MDPPRALKLEGSSSPGELEEWSPASLEVVLLCPVVVSRSCRRGVGHWAPVPCGNLHSLDPVEHQHLPQREEWGWDTVSLWAWGPCDLLGTEHCWELPWQGREWEGRRVWWNPVDLDQLAATGRSKGWRYLKTPPPSPVPTTNKKLS